MRVFRSPITSPSALIRPHSSWIAAGAALLVAGLAALVRLYLPDSLDAQASFLIFVPAVVVGAALGGAGPGVFATLLGLASGSLSDPGRSAALEISCPSSEAAMALVGAGHRIGIPAKAREVRGVPRVVVRDGEAIRGALYEMGARRTAGEWDQMRQRREVRAGVNRLVNFDDANLRRSAQAAVAACARVERALEILGDEVPDHLQQAGALRLAHRDASLDELGHHADPPLTKDAVAGRIRRLLAMADKKAEAEGIPGTEAAVPVGADD